MSTATVEAGEAEARAAEIAEQIAEHEAFLAEVDRLLDAAVIAEVRSGKEGQSRRLQKRKDTVEAELPTLRRRLAGYAEIAAEHQEEVAKARREGLRRQGDELDAEEREAVAEVVARFRRLEMAAAKLLTVRSRRQTFRLANPVDMAGYPESVLDPPPSSFRAVLDGVYRAVVEPDNVGDVRHLGGWQEFV